MRQQTGKDEEAEAAKAFIELMQAITLNLVKCDDSTMMPVSGCSGFIVERGGRHFLLSAV